MNDIVAEVRTILEPDPIAPAFRDVAVDETGAKPLAFRAETLYVWPGPLAEAPVETGPTARRDFTVSVVLTGPEAGEEADGRRSVDVSDWFDEKREAYLEAVRANQRGTAWHHIRAAEDNGPANLELRALSLRLTGYVIVS